MNAYIIRSKSGETGAPYFGLFVARDVTELFWAVDEFADPYLYQYARLKKAGGIMLAANYEFCLNDAIKVEEGDHDLCEFEYDGDGVGGNILDAVSGTQTKWNDFTEDDRQ